MPQNGLPGAPGTVNLAAPGCRRHAVCPGFAAIPTEKQKKPVPAPRPARGPPCGTRLAQPLQREGSPDLPHAMPSLALTARPETRALLSPRMQQAVRLLQMSALDFARALRDTAEGNPLLEVDETLPEESPPPAASQAAAPVDEPRPGWLDGLPGRRPGGEDDADRLAGLAWEPGLQEHLHAQLRLLALPVRGQLLAHALVESLDDDGYLRVPADEAAGGLGLTPAPRADEVAAALQRVQSLEPAGVGARSLAECLALQLGAIACPHARALAARIVERYLPVLAAHDLPRLARQLKATPEAVRAACDAIRHLAARPGWAVGGGGAHAIVPDVEVRRSGTAWAVALNEAAMPRVRLNDHYAGLVEHDRAGPLGTCLQDARWTVRNVALRCDTILGVARSIVARQPGFFAHGPLALKPLCLNEVAADVGTHASTVSRANSNKFMRTPFGVFEFGYFFARPVVSHGGQTCAPRAVRALVEDMIAAEPARAPLTDTQIARELVRQGLPVARRTVTKYRQSLRIEPAERRRMLHQSRSA
jgi:RNA polymerase sigma-54 factor